MVPVMDQAGLAWRDGESYDQWDEIGTALYNALIAGEIQNATSLRHSNSDLDVVPYDMEIVSYAGKSFVGADIGKPSPAPIMRISAGNGDFAYIEVVELAANGDPIGVLSLELHETDFVFVICITDVGDMRVESCIEVDE